MSEDYTVVSVVANEAFRRRFPFLYGTEMIPEPKRGGTFLYCRVFVERDVPKYDRLGRRTRYTERKQVPCNQRFRILKRYRRHWRKFHAAA